MMRLSFVAKRRAAWLLIIAMVAQPFTAYQSFALTGGPAQPEMQSFEPIGTSEMVDVSSGSFVYNIPLMQVGDYPINLAYHSGIGMDDEASCLGGLGWNINVGVINRSMRGLPDDFSGDKVAKEFNMKPNTTYGGKLGVGFELFGVKAGSLSGKLNVSLGGFYNNYRGVGLEFGVVPGFSAAIKGSTSMTLGLGLTASSASGVSFSPQIGLNYSRQTQSASATDLGYLNGGITLGSTANSRQGVQALTMGVSLGISGKEGTVNEKGKMVPKEDGKSGSRSLYGGDASFDFASPTYTPGGQFSFQNQSVSLAFTAGGALFGGHPSGTLTGYFSKQELAEKQVESPAFGYLYAQNAKNRYGAILDFNREKDMAFTENTPNLPVPVPTNDIYSAVGQGIAGSYQLKRGDVGVFSDPVLQSYGAGLNFGLEMGFGNAYHAGADIVANFSNTVSQAWTDQNKAMTPLAFQDTLSGNNFEPAYFKIAGDKSAESDPGAFNRLGGTRPVRVELDKGGAGQMTVVAQDKLEGVAGPLPTKRTKREKRNQPITYLSATEAAHFGLEKSIISYKPNAYGSYLAPTPESTIAREGGVRKAHHISEITTLRQDGLRYIYGIPAYNTEQKEVGFSVKGPGDCINGLVGYEPGIDNSKDNKKGAENYFSKTSLPPYAHAYLLTAVLSPDYVDLTGDGATPDDLGTYTKFRYTRIQSAYRWRVPYELNKANFNEGFKSDPNDDKANYLYGVKEYWVLHSVESKTQLAEFYYGDREDGIGVAGENGGFDNTQTLKKLEKIALFSLPDRRNNGAGAEPIKTVHFKYDYRLGSGIPNNRGGGGKLTLIELSFTYGRSNKGKLSPYKFKYNNFTDPEYKYNQKACNRWGAFQPNKATSCDLDGPLSTSDFPYIPQDNRAAQDQYAAWQNLSEIKLPSGGIIKVAYEANDYAFVQNHRAMEMVEIAGFGKDRNTFPQNLTKQLYSGVSAPNNYVFFKLPSQQVIDGSVAPEDADAEITRRYLSDPGGASIASGYLYFKCLVDIGNAGHQFEYVPGYVQVKAAGAASSSPGGKYDYGYVQLKDACVRDKETACGDRVSPIAKAAWQFARLNLPRIAYGEPDPGAASGEQMATALGSLVTQFHQFVDGFNDQMQRQNFGKEVKLGKSWIRLFSPSGKKTGGGARVSSIRISDEWPTMSGLPNTGFDYGQEYVYTKVEQGDTISSGVATYEPLVGGDENPFRQPVQFKEALLLAPDNNHYQEKPYGESFFPAPEIVYSQVTVRNLKREGVKRNATGHIVYEYYTARDFPTKVTDTGVHPVRKRTNPIFRLLKINSKDYMTAAQGFAVELNDMPGKPKAQWVCDESGVQISGVEYRYKTDTRGLNNEVPVILPSGRLETRTIGLELSMVADSREALSSVACAGVHLNSDGFLATIFPMLAVVPLPSIQSEETRFRSMVTAKVVHRYGLLQTTIAHDLGSQVSTENLAWDSETGEVMLTKTYNEYEDPVFNLNFPAHWAYRGMQAAYQNIGAVFHGAVSQKGIFPVAALSNIFTPGDELSVTKPSDPHFILKGWVKDVYPDRVYIIDENGQPINPNTYKIKILRSGHRNQQLSSIGSLSCLQYPVINKGGINFLHFSNKQILNASAIEYDDRWQTWCGEKSAGDTCICIAKPVAAELLALLNSQISGGHFVLHPRNNPYDIPAGQAIALKQWLDSKCPGFPENGSWYRFATELTGKDLRCYFGKGYSDKVPCWQECLIIKDFDVLVLPAPGPTVLSFFDAGPDRATCDGKNICFKANIETYPDQQGEVTKTKRAKVLSFCGSGACFDFYSCTLLHQLSICGNQAPGDTVNPYRLNIRGVYRPKKTWTYLTNRVPEPTAALSAATNIRTDGYFSQFSSFWAATPSNIWSPQPAGWTWAKQATRYNPVGNEIENQNALGNYSAELTGYNNTQVTAVGNNARYRQIAFEGFEDYGFTPYSCLRHFGFPVEGDTTSLTSHTGKYSIAVQPNRPVSNKFPLVAPVCPPLPGLSKGPLPYRLDICDCVGRFSPDPGKYVFSAWVKERQPLETLSYNHASVEIKTGGQTFSFKAGGQIIEGWQRISGEFTVPAGATDIGVALLGGGVPAWFDDLRILPFDGSLKSFVYDPRTLRFTYELDENNYFTRYEYDASGLLERVKKETERGVMSIQESRFGQKKQ